jgi:GT2 family glycosyltransferase
MILNERIVMHTEKVVAITVTYNRSQTLKRCLHALLNQDRKPDHIIVVDNCSNQGEKELIRSFTENNKIITVLWLKENSGGAGGFEAGMRKAMECYKPDWYWVMDDDAYPRRDCLMLLLEKSDCLENVGCMAPAIYGIDLNEYQMYHHKRLSPLLLEDINVAESYEALKPVTLVEANAFVGPLISKSAVETVGIADGSLFIYGDDTEYTYRLSRVKNIFLVKDAIIEHQDPPVANNYMQPKGWWKEYYRIRNRFFLYQEFHKDPAKRFLSQLCMSGITVKLMVAAIIKPKYRSNRKLRLWILTKALSDGILNKRGCQVDPSKYMKML